MRKILFKAKRINDHGWVYGDLIRNDNKYYPVTLIGGIIFSRDKYTNELSLDGHWVSEVDPETVSQYTGWNDRHQTKIFENDIVEFVSGTSLHRYLIWWQREGSMLTAVPLDGIAFNGSDYWNGKFPQFEYSTFCLMMLDPYGDFRDIRVIGNIHDNPELLEE